MKVEQVMSGEVRTCDPEETLNRAAQLMWDYDIGCVPVISNGLPIGMITDRDICMAAYTQGRRLDEITVRSVMSTQLRTCAPGDSIEMAAAQMKKYQLRRLLVVGPRSNVVGLLSISDLSRGASAEPNAKSREQYVQQLEATLAAVTRPRAMPQARV